MNERLKSLIHNTMIHPVAGWLWFFGLDDLGDRVHELLAPDPAVESATMSIMADRIAKDIGEMFDVNRQAFPKSQAAYAKLLADRMKAAHQ